MELKSCPFCGSEAKIILHKTLDKVRVECTKCAARMGSHIIELNERNKKTYFRTEKEAIKAWNRRV